MDDLNEDVYLSYWNWGIFQLVVLGATPNSVGRIPLMIITMPLHGIPILGQVARTWEKYRSIFPPKVVNSKGTRNPLISELFLVGEWLQFDQLILYIFLACSRICMRFPSGKWRAKHVTTSWSLHGLWVRGNCHARTAEKKILSSTASFSSLRVFQIWIKKTWGNLCFRVRQSGFQG